MEAKPVKVQITLERQDAQLYRMLTNKKYGLSAALKLLYRNEEMRPLFFTGSNVEVNSVLVATTKINKVSSDGDAKEGVSQTQEESKKDW